MKLHKQRSYVKVEGALSSQSFRIKEGPKIIKLLSANLYKDKILAIVRELSCNAYDSHIKAGIQSKPFVIKLPSSLNNLFEIRDFGEGLSKDDMNNVFCVYGESTKDESQDFIGALGLGAKSPFSYAKSFTIESFNNGNHNIYSAYIGEDGVPNLDLLSENKSDEPSGLKIVVPCEASDVYNFQTAAARVFTFFDPKPKFLGQSVPSIPKIENVLESKNGWAIRKENYGVHTGLLAKMGVVTYPVRFEDSNLPENVKELFDCPITLEFQLGDLDVGPGREELSYDVQSRSCIVQKCNLVIDEFKQKVEDELKACKTLFQARKTIGSILNKLPSVKLRSIIPTTGLQWQGQELFPKDFLNYGLYIYLPKDFSGVEYSCSHIDIPYQNTRVNSSRQLCWENKFEIILADCKVGNQSRAKEYMTTNSGILKEIFLVSFPTDKEKKALLKFLGAEESELIKASSLPKPATQVRVSTGGNKTTTTKVMEFIEGRYAMSTWWKPTAIDIAATDGFYVEFNQYAAYDASHKISPGDLDCHIKNVNILLKEDKKTEIGPLYGIKTAIIPKLAKVGTKWQNVFDIIRTRMDEYAKDDKFVLAKQLHENFVVGGSYTVKKSTYSYDYLYKLDLTELTQLKKLVKNKDFIELVEELESQNETITDYKEMVLAYIKLESFYKAPLKSVKFKKAEAIEKELYDRWPLLCQLRNDFSDMKLLVGYVNSN